jgi:hypothetical protein
MLPQHHRVECPLYVSHCLGGILFLAPSCSVACGLGCCTHFVELVGLFVSFLGCLSSSVLYRLHIRGFFNKVPRNRDHCSDVTYLKPTKGATNRQKSLCGAVMQKLLLCAVFLLSGVVSTIACQLLVYQGAGGKSLIV